MKHRHTIIAAVAIIAAFYAFMAVAQPERVDGLQEGVPVTLLNGQTQRDRPPSVIRCNYTPWRQPYDIHGIDQFIISGFGAWTFEGNGVVCTQVYIGREAQYPTMRLYCGDLEDGPIDQELMAERTRYWSNGLYRVRGLIYGGAMGVIEWLPVDDDGNLIDPADWGWVTPR